MTTSPDRPTLFDAETGTPAFPDLWDDPMAFGPREPAVCPECGQSSSYPGTVVWCPHSGWLS